MPEKGAIVIRQKEDSSSVCGWIRERLAAPHYHYAAKVKMFQRRAYLNRSRLSGDYDLVKVS
jgi:hypothetical protein